MVIGKHRTDFMVKVIFICVVGRGYANSNDLNTRSNEAYAHWRPFIIHAVQPMDYSRVKQ